LWNVSANALDYDEEDEVLTPDDNLVTDLLAEEKKKAKLENRSPKFKEIVVNKIEGVPVLDCVSCF